VSSSACSCGTEGTSRLSFGQPIERCDLRTSFDSHRPSQGWGGDVAAARLVEPGSREDGSVREVAPSGHRQGVESPRDERLHRLAVENTPAVSNYLRHRLYPLAKADLDDLLEEVLIVVWKRLEDVPRGDELPWMINVARNVLSNAKRSHRRRSKMESSLRLLPAHPSAEMWVLASSAVRGAMEQLSEADRDILMLHNWDGLDVHGVAVALSISDRAADSRLSRARIRFHAAFNAHGPEGYVRLADRTAHVEEGS
jgi:RNA polymerase sigma factor (sigma-70 family)